MFLVFQADQNLVLLVEETPKADQMQVIEETIMIGAIIEKHNS
jgi:hypothetical protein